VINNTYLKILAILLALVFVSGCAVYVRDEDWPHHHRGYWRWHSFMSQPSMGFMNRDILAKNVMSSEPVDLGY
jgi:hypothetical protein